MLIRYALIKLSLRRTSQYSVLLTSILYHNVQLNRCPFCYEVYYVLTTNRSNARFVALLCSFSLTLIGKRFVRNRQPHTKTFYLAPFSLLHPERRQQLIHHEFPSFVMMANTRVYIYEAISTALRIMKYGEILHINYRPLWSMGSYLFAHNSETYNFLVIYLDNNTIEFDT